MDALVLESVFPDIGSALSDRLHARLGPVWGRAADFCIAPVFRVLMPFLLGVRFEDLRPIDRIGA